MFENTLQFTDKESSQETSLTLAERCLQAVSAGAPVLKRILAKYGNLPLAEYLHSLRPSDGLPLQSRQDFLDIYSQEVALLLGVTVGKKAAEELDSWPMVLTANHLGVDFFSQSVQTNLLFYLLKRTLTPPPVIIPIIACGSVPLNNITYPKGGLLYKLKNGSYSMVPKRLPVFSDKMKRTLVSVAPPFDKVMVDRALKRLEKMIVLEEIDTEQAEAMQLIFQQDYKAKEVMELRSYSSQSLVVNNRIWQRLFFTDKIKSHVVNLDMENIVSRLLEVDLNNRNSLAWTILMDPRVRRKVIERLDDHRACWNLQALRQRLERDKNNDIVEKMSASCGTVFFWGVDKRSRRIPLLLIDNGDNQLELKGVDDEGSVIVIDLNVQSILTALKNKNILPSLFTSYSVLAFARGLTCLGGYFQAEYLPMMQKELVAALRETGSYSEEARLVENVETGFYLSGMQMVMAGDADALVPAGPVEIIAGGGLTDKNLDQILALSVRDAHMASLFETIDDIIPLMEQKTDLKQSLAQYCWSLRDKVVIK